ncbi:hypothetical protein OCAR_4383 [Afipia carboxidovorans OM5]|nr:hypothetical protein OCAR_4383 [Afipia carboxidovorans OM5]
MAQSLSVSARVLAEIKVPGGLELDMTTGENRDAHIRLRSEG